jgi:hypothetical protein
VQPLYFIPDEQYVKVECDLKDESGELLFPTFWVEVRKNLTIGERSGVIDQLNTITDEVERFNDQVLDRHDDLEAALEAAKATGDNRSVRAINRQVSDLIAEQRNQLDRFTDRRRAIVAPYIRGWSLGERLPDGTVQPLPAPREAGPDAFTDVPLLLTNWIVSTCQNAYRLGKPMGTTTASAGSPEPTPAPTAAGPQVIDTSPTRRSRKRS